MALSTTAADAVLKKALPAVYSQFIDLLPLSQYMLTTTQRGVEHPKLSKEGSSKQMLTAPILLRKLMGRPTAREVVFNVKSGRLSWTAGTLEGNETEFKETATKLTLNRARGAFAMTDFERYTTEADFFGQLEADLPIELADHVEQYIVDALGAQSGAVADATANNAWYTANADRVQFVDEATAKAASVTVFDTAAATIAAGDIFTSAVADALINKCRTAKIKPFKVRGMNTHWLCLLGTSMFNQARADSTIISQTNSAYQGFGKDHPLFGSELLYYSNLFILHVPKIEDQVVAAANYGGTVDMHRGYVLGGDAVGVGIAEEKLIRETRDYGGVMGVGAQHWIDAAKLQVDHLASGTVKDNGVVSLFGAGV